MGRVIELGDKVAFKPPYQSISADRNRYIMQDFVWPINHYIGTIIGINPLYMSYTILADAGKLFENIYGEDILYVIEGETDMYLKKVSKYGYIAEDIFVPSKSMEDIKKVIFNNPATIVYWKDGTKTVVKVLEGEQYSKWSGLALCVCKKMFCDNDTVKFHKMFKKWCEVE